MIDKLDDSKKAYELRKAFMVLEVQMKAVEKTQEYIGKLSALMSMNDIDWAIKNS